MIMNAYQDYVIRVTRPANVMRVSRHGIAVDKGGQFVADEPYRWPDTPVYLALESMAELHPGCDLTPIFQTKP